MVKQVLSSVAAVVLLLAASRPPRRRRFAAWSRDVSGAPIAGTRVVVRDVATRQEVVVETGPDGRYEAQVPSTGTYLVSVTREGFSEAAQTVVIESAEAALDVPLTLDVGTVTSAVVVTASRAERDTKQIPLHVDTITKAAIEQTNQTSTGDALTMAANITPVGNGPFGVRPRLRGLDSTRLLVLVDGERLNTARQATDRTGAEVGLVSPDAINRMEVVNGAGTLMYGSDALAGTINIITNEATFSPVDRWLYGFNGFYSSNENGIRGTGTVGFTSPRFTVRVQAGAEDFEDYTAGDLGVEDTRPLHESGVLHQADTIDDNFGFAFNAFPEPFNAPYVRTDNEVLNSQAHGNYVNASSQIKLGERRSVRIRYQRRRMEDIGFPDFEQPYFFNDTSLPFSNLDRVSARYEAQAVTPWLANLSATAYYQRTERLLQNLLPVQFPAPTPTAFFPISVFRLDVLSNTEQRVWTPGVDIQAVLVPASNHLLTTGLTFYQDNSSDRRSTSTQTSLVGQVVLGQRGPAPVVLPSPMPLGPPVPGNPVRVPDASLRDIALFAQDEWRLALEPVAHRRPPRRFLERDLGGDARLRHRCRHRRRAAADRSVDAAQPERRHLHPAVADRRHRAGGQPGRPGEPVHPLRAQLPASEPRGDVLRGPGHDRQHRAQRAGEARDGQQLRHRRQVRGRPGFGRRLLLREPGTTTSSRRISSSPPRPPDRWRRRPTTPTSGSPASSSASTRRS